MELTLTFPIINSRGSYIYTGITIQVTVVLVVIRPVYDGWLYF